MDNLEPAWFELWRECTPFLRQDEQATRLIRAQRLSFLNRTIAHAHVRTIGHDCGEARDGPELIRDGLTPARPLSSCLTILPLSTDTAVPGRGPVISKRAQASSPRRDHRAAAPRQIWPDGHAAAAAG